MDISNAFRNRTICTRIIRKIHESIRKPLKFMEVCGTHTMAIFQNGIRSLLPKQISLISGPGCPVCVTHQGDIDAMLSLGSDPKTIAAVFGDMMQVPGSETSLINKRAAGCDIRVICSALDAVEIAGSHPDREVVFFGIGFETTAPTVGAAILAAEKEAMKNFSVFPAHKLMPPALEALLSDPSTDIDGFLLPGHVAAVTGSDAFLPVAGKYRIPCVVSGFEPADILQSIWMLVRQNTSGDVSLENSYTRVVTPVGNRKAKEIMTAVFEPATARWRGIGEIPQSGLKLRKKFHRFDAIRKFGIQVECKPDSPGCECGNVLKGVLSPLDCPLFGQTCVPEKPFGPCMVSAEGACAAYYRYSRRNQ